ncbi:hypothetical protein CROQUDRAFT_669502 [Cronartium quercuum f. sp. fusiforme G11]|uniref:Uncharacterized protein n=1 Tax=Cronartium quercuum f. sp. fusiforme G11 TaxID=708437 RepID=A0A9P6TE49_9BASI|nr:hypothetical protein CROQUDRAFT_669502 [Cronartium quercuum f. sp. fusiforme G11]
MDTNRDTVSTAPSTPFTNTYHQYKFYRHGICQYLFSAFGFNVKLIEKALAIISRKPSPQKPPHTPALWVGKAQTQQHAAAKRSMIANSDIDVIKTLVGVDQLKWRTKLPRCRLRWLKYRSR